MYILSFFTDDGSPKTGLTPTIKIRDVLDGSLLINGSSMPEVGDGFYRYNYATYDSEKDYAIVCDGGISLSDADRYVYAGNENYVEDVTNGVWSEDLSTYDTGAGRIQQLQVFDGYVRIDTVSGTSGTAFPIGTYKMPSNNLTDTLTICANNNIGKIRVRNDLTIEASHDISNKSFETRGIMGTTVTLETGSTADKAAFRYLNLEGTVSNGDELLVENCSILDLENFSGIMQGVSFEQGSEISISSWAEIYNCRAGGEPTNEPEINIGDSVLNIQQYRGNLKLTNKTGTSRTVAGFLPGNVTITNTCIAGKIQILGIGEVEQDNSGDNCQVDLDAVISRTSISESVWDENLVNHINDNTTGHALMHESYNNTIFVDPINGLNGSNYPHGIRQHPVKNITDILAVSDKYNLSKVHVLGSLTIDGGEDISGFTFISDRSLGNEVVVTNSITNETYFENLTVSGTMNGSVRYTTSVLGAINNFDGGAKNCLITGDINITGTGANYLTDCDTYVIDDTYKQIDVGDKLLNIIRCRGTYEITNYTGSSVITIDLVGGHIKIADSCISGMIAIGGLVNLIDNSGSGCVVIDGTLTETGIVDGVLDETVTDHLVAGSLGYVINESSDDSKRALGLLDENSSLDQQVYNTEHRLTSARKRIYSVKTSVGTDNDVLATYNITATWSGQELTSYKMVRL